jgi:hypothetical protein
MSLTYAKLNNLHPANCLQEEEPIISLGFNPTEVQGVENP